MMVHNFDPVLIDFGIVQIRWYSLAYVVGILTGWWYGRTIIKKQITDTNQKNYINNFDDLIGYLVVGIVLGGRLGYVMFYNSSFYFENSSEILKLWKGGMSFHGGLVGVIVTTYIFSNVKNLNYKVYFDTISSVAPIAILPKKIPIGATEDIVLNYKVYFDTISSVAPIGIFFGRIANFINGELYGLPTEKPWGIVFPEIDNITRHPSQIYEALLEGIVLFFILNFFVFRKIFNHGTISFLFLILYGIFRIVSEQFREPDEHIGYILKDFSMGSVLSFAMIIFGILFLLKVIFNEKNR